MDKERQKMWNLQRKKERQYDKMLHEALTNRKVTYKDIFAILPKDIVKIIFFFLDWKTICIMKSVCKHWQLLIDHPFFETIRIYWASEDPTKKTKSKEVLPPIPRVAGCKRTLSVDGRTYSADLSFTLDGWKRNIDCSAILEVRKKRCKQPTKSGKSPSFTKTSKPLPVAWSRFKLFDSPQLKQITPALMTAFIGYCEKNIWQPAESNGSLCESKTVFVNPTVYNGPELLGVEYELPDKWMDDDDDYDDD